MPDHIILKLSRYLENSTNNMIPTYRNILFIKQKDMCLWTLGLSSKIWIYELFKDFLTKYRPIPTFYIKLSLIFLWRNFSGVLIGKLIKEDVQNILLLVCKQALKNWHNPLIQSRGFDAWSFTFGLHWSWSKIHRWCSAGTTSSTCYQP